MCEENPLSSHTGVTARVNAGAFVTLSLTIRYGKRNPCAPSSGYDVPCFATTALLGVQSVRAQIVRMGVLISAMPCNAVHSIGHDSISRAIANVWGWRNAYIALGIPTVVFGIVFYILLGRMKDRQKANPDPSKEEERTPAPSGIMRRLVVFLILSTFTAAIINSIVSFVPFLMVDHFGVSKEMAAGSLSLIYLAVFWASPLGGYLADRLGSVRVVIVVCFTAGPAVFLLTMLPYGWALGGMLVLLGMTIFSRMTASESFIVSETPAEKRSTVLGIYYFSGQEGGGILTPVVGYLIDRFGFTAAFAMAGGALFTITLLCSFWLSERRNGSEIMQ